MQRRFGFSGFPALTIRAMASPIFWCFGLRHLDHITQTYVGYYNRHRPHQSLGSVPLERAGQPPPELAGSDQVGPVRQHAYLGGLLNRYERKAA